MGDPSTEGSGAASASRIMCKDFDRRQGRSSLDCADSPWTLLHVEWPHEMAWLTQNSGLAMASNLS